MASYRLLCLRVFLRFPDFARLFFERAALRLFLDVEARRNVLFRVERPPPSKKRRVPGPERGPVPGVLANPGRGLPSTGV